MKKLRMLLSIAFVVSILVVGAQAYTSTAHAAAGTYYLSYIELDPGYVMCWEQVDVVKNRQSRFYIKTNAKGLTLSVGFKAEHNSPEFQDYFFDKTTNINLDTGWKVNELSGAQRPFVCNHTANVTAEIYDGSYVEYNR